MPKGAPVYGEINHKSDMEKVYRAIRAEVEKATSRADLTRLYRRAGYLITLTHAPAWEEKFGPQAEELRRLGEEQFRLTARKINRRAGQLGTEADYDERWGE